MEKLKVGKVCGSDKIQGVYSGIYIILRYVYWRWGVIVKTFLCIYSQRKKDIVISMEQRDWEILRFPTQSGMTNTQY